MDEKIKKPMSLLQMLFGALDCGFITIWGKHVAGEKSTFWYDLSTGGALEQAAQKALEMDARNYDVYVSTCPARNKGKAGSRINQGQVSYVPALFMDADVGKPNCPASKKELLDKLLTLPVSPSAIVDSGSGYHLYWALAEPLPINGPNDLGEARKILRGFAQGIADKLGYSGFDLSASEPARVLRVPGTHNCKRGTRVPVDIVHIEYRAQYDLDTLTPFVAISAVPTVPPNVAPTSSTEPHALSKKTTSSVKGTSATTETESPAKPISLSDRQILTHLQTGKHGDRLSRLWNGQWEEDYPSHSEADASLLCSLAFWTEGDAGRMDSLFRQSGLFRNKWDERHGQQTYGEMSIGKALATTTAFYDPQHTGNDNEITDDPAFDRFTRAYQVVAGYSANKGMLWAEAAEKDGVVSKPLANFACLITNEITRDDGVETKKDFEIEGVTATGKHLPAITIPTSKFASMNWPIDAWGAVANAYPGSTTKDKTRYAIQAASAALLKRHTIYTHTGWRTINGKTAFLYHGGAVGIDGISVELRGSLSMYSLPPSTGDVKEAIAASLEMLTVLPPRVAIPLLAFVYLAPLHEPLEKAGCPPAFVLFLVGRSGTHKTSVAALALNHFGTAFNPKRLPSSFNDTACAAQDKAFVLKDLPLLVDDFCPSLNIAEQRRRIGIAQQLIRAWGDHAERGRMRSDATLQKAKPPRGLGAMTGEDVPCVGESGLARLFLIDVKPNDIRAGQDLTKLQNKAQAGYLARSMRGYLEWLIPQYDKLPDMLAELFAEHRKMAQDRLIGAHGRQPEAIAWLLVGFRMALQFWQNSGVLDDPMPLWVQAQDVLFEHSEAQRQTIKDEEPVRMFLNALDELQASGTAILLNLANQEDLWPRVGCIGFEDSERLYLVPGAAFGAVQEHFKSQGVIFPISKNQLWKRMADIGLIETWGAETTKVKHVPGFGSQRLVYVKKASERREQNETYL